MQNEKIDLRGKSEEEILKAYIEIAKKTLEEEEKYEQMKNREENIKFVKEIKSNK